MNTHPVVDVLSLMSPAKSPSVNSAKLCAYPSTPLPSIFYSVCDSMMLREKKVSDKSLDCIPIIDSGIKCELGAFVRGESDVGSCVDTEQCLDI